MINETKDVYIHLGPHKTGSTAIQDFFGLSTLSMPNVCFLHDDTTHLAARKIAQKKYDEAEDIVISISRRISHLPHAKILISQEDFSGDLPGRSGSRKVYPTIGKNIRLLKKWLAPHRVKFLFFRRNTDDWMASCYAQNVRYRHRYYDFSEFSERIDWGEWSATINRVQQNFSDVLTIADYSKRCDAGIIKAAAWLGVDRNSFPPYQAEALLKNASLDGKQLSVFERINHRAQQKALIPIYKERALAYMNGERPHASSSSSERFSAEWPRLLSGASKFVGLKGLTDRIRTKNGEQEDQPDLLPELPLNLADLSRETMPHVEAVPEVSRRQMADQVSILRYHLRGQSKLSFINAICVSYLRRDTPHTGKARDIFHHIWENSGTYLVTELSARWLISTLQTFVDHPKHPVQQTIGTAGYFYGNLVKIYEGERALEGLESDREYTSGEPITNSGFRGLDRYKVGGTDLLLNTNALALELSSLDKVSGIVLEELLLRTKHSCTVFQRHDMTRSSMGIDTSPFSDVWSFYEKPSDSRG